MRTTPGDKPYQQASVQRLAPSRTERRKPVFEEKSAGRGPDLSNDPVDTYGPVRHHERQSSTSPRELARTLQTPRLLVETVSKLQRTGKLTQARELAAAG